MDLGHTTKQNLGVKVTIARGCQFRCAPLGLGEGALKSALSQDEHEDDSPRKAKREQSGGIVLELQDTQYMNSAPLGLCHELWLGTSKKFPA